MRTVVIGIGNPVRSDDGVGLAVARAVRERVGDRPDVDVEELWAGGLRLVEAMAGYDRAIVIDAMVTGTSPPGTVRRLDLADLGEARNVTCVHDASLPTALALWRMGDVPVPSDITIWGIEGQDLQTLSEELTVSVSGAVAVATDAIMDELARGSHQPLSGPQRRAQ
jgi:hydrogenase maturation protease